MSVAGLPREEKCEQILSEKKAILVEDASIYEDSVQLNYIREDGLRLFCGPPKAVCPSVELLKKGTGIRILYGINEKVIKVELDAELANVAYEIVKKAKGKLRLYLNDPATMKHFPNPPTSTEGPISFSFPVPIELEGEIVLGKTKDKKLHYFFTHDDFITAFMDLDEPMK